MEEFDLIKIEMVRGVNNRFFFVAREKSSETYFVYVIYLVFMIKENQWNLKVRQIHISTTGSIIALVRDQNYPKEIDSYWTQNNDLKIHKAAILNQIFFIGEVCLKNVTYLIVDLLVTVLL